MTVYQLPNGSWRYDFTAAGRRYLKAGFATKSQALAAQEASRHDVLTGRSPVYSTVGDLATAYLLDSERSVSRQWAYQVRKKLDRGFGHMASYLLTEVRPAHINAVLQDLAAQGLAASTVNEYRKIAIALFNFGVRMESIASNPAAKTKKVPEPKHEAVIISTADLRRVVLAARPALASFLVAMSQTGARHGELARLRWSAVFTSAAEPFVVLSTRKKHGGNEAQQPQPVSALAVRAIESQRGQSETWVWPSPRGGPVVYRTHVKALRAITDKLGLPAYGFHAVRHWAGFQATAMGKSRKAVARFLRHESSAVTEVYMHAIAPELWEIARRLEAEMEVESDVGEREQG